MGTVKILVVLAAMAATVAYAGPSSSSGGSRGSSGGGGASRSAGAVTSQRSGPTAMGTRPQQNAGKNAARRTTFGSFSPGRTAQARDQRASPARRSLLAGRNQPSARVTELIREKEASGPGWFGTGLLVWLLSQHDLSASDKAWIEDRIATQGKEEEQLPALLGAVMPPVAFHIQGLRQSFAPNVEAELTVRATRGGTQLPVRCTFPSGSIQPEGAAVRVKWTPGSPGVQLLTCDADGHQARRLLHAGGDS